MDNDVHRFSQNARAGQWRPLGHTERIGRVFCPLPQSPPVKQDWSHRSLWRETTMCRTRSQAVSTGLLAIGLVNVKKKSLVVLATWVVPG